MHATVFFKVLYYPMFEFYWFVKISTCGAQSDIKVKNNHVNPKKYVILTV